MQYYIEMINLLMGNALLISLIKTISQLDCFYQFRDNISPIFMRLSKTVSTVKTDFVTNY